MPSVGPELAISLLLQRWLLKTITKTLYKLVPHFLYFSNVYPKTCKKFWAKDPQDFQPKRDKFFTKYLGILSEHFTNIAFVGFSIFLPVYNKKLAIEAA